MTRDPHRIDDIARLRAIYGAPSEAARAKVVDRITPAYRQLIEAAPFAALATCGPGGLDVSPRGDPAPLAKVRDEKTVLLADRRGNNRIDSLENIAADPRVALLLLIPGIGETVRINGAAEIRIDPELLDALAHEGKRPRTVLAITVHELYFQCQKAVRRARLWDPEAQLDRATLPSAGAILESLDPDFDGAAYDAAYPERMAQTIY